uniref:Reverse transcriptase domain-containing protein n=1 Tax=Scylla olivacea TaxID=85551 RepID=A0A0P4VXM0_SCYOL
MLNQEISDTFVCNVGVKQGENLSSVLFAFYVNDIESKLTEYNCSYVNFGDDFLNMYLKLFVIMYADDTIILCDSEDGMKQALVALNLYCNEWKLKLNCNKTKVVVFSRGRQNLTMNLNLVVKTLK